MKWMLRFWLIAIALNFAVNGPLVGGVFLLPWLVLAREFVCSGASRRAGLVRPERGPLDGY